MWLLPVRYPPEWRASLVSRGTAVFWSIASAYLFFVGFRASLPGGMGVGLVFVFCAALLSGLGAVLTLFCRVRFEHIDLFIWYLLSVACAGMSVNSSDIVLRHRSQMLAFCFFIGGPLYFGMPSRTYLPYSLWVVVVNCLAVYSFSVFSEEVVPLRIYSTNVVYWMCFLALCRQQERFFSMLYNAELALAFDKDAAESLISMFCDAHFWLSSDAQTVVSSDFRFTSLIGRNMNGEVISSLFEHSAEDWLRLQKVLSEAPLDNTPAPVTVLPVTFRDASGAAINVNLYIVGCRTRHVEHTEHGRRGYLIGICAKGEQIIASSTVLKVGAEIETVPGAPSEVPASAQTTGAIFHDRESNPDVVTTLEDVKTLGWKEHWSIDKAEVKLTPGRVYGEGGFGFVVQGKFYGAAVAVKVSRSALNLSDKQDFSSMCNELRILRRLRHPALVQFLGAVVDVPGHRLALVLEAVEGGNLTAFMELGQGPDLPKRYKVLTDICSALQYLNSRSPCVVHGDIKSSNVLLEQYGLHIQAKLLDFGLSRLLHQSSRPLGGTLRFMAPEVFLKVDPRPAPSADVFSFGRLAFFVFTRRRPLWKLNNEQLRACCRNNDLPPESWPEEFMTDARFQPSGLRMLKACLHQVPSRRPGFKEVRAMLDAWFDGLRDCTSAKDEEGEEVNVDDYDWQDGLDILAVDPRRPKLERSSRREKLVFPHLVCTSMESRRLMLTEVMIQWNYEYPKAMCCRFHAATRALQRSVSDLQVGSCRNVRQVFGGQCPSCGILCEAEESCPLCEIIDVEPEQAPGSGSGLTLAHTPNKQSL